MVNTEIRLIIFFVAKDEETIHSAKTRLGADSGSDHELFIAKFRLRLKKVGKTTRPFRYDLNQIPRLSEEVLQIVVKRREAKSKGENERYKHLNAELQR